MTMERITELTKFVTFRLDEEVFALEIDKVQEVLDVTAVTKVPQTPEFMRGVINLRGNVVPVVDLRLKFGMSETEDTVDTRIVIVEVTVDGETAVLGALADAVREVVELEPEEIGPPPKIGTRLRTEFIVGMGRRNDEFIIILDVDLLFSAEDLAAVQATEPGTLSPQDAVGEAAGNAATGG